MRRILLALALICAAGTARAACTLPFTLTAHTLASASQVMANFNAVAACTQALVPAGVSSIFYAKDYGTCTWDITNDIGVCINLARDAAVAAGGGTILIPVGRFGLSTMPSITTSSLGIQCGWGPSITNGSGTPSVSTNGTELKWIGSSGGRMMSVGTSSGQLLSNFVRNCRFNGNNGLAADGLYVASTFGGHFDDLSFVGGFNGGNVFNIDVNALAGGGAQNNTFDNLYIDNATGGTYTSNQFRLGTFIDGTGVHGNAAFNYGRNIFIGGGNGSTGILCVGCDNNRFSDARVFNGDTSVDLTIAVSGANLFPANGNIFDHIQYTGDFIARGTTSFATCSGTTCTYNNSLSIDQTNATPFPIEEAGSDLHWTSNSGYAVGLSFKGIASVKPAFSAASNNSIWGACQANSYTYAANGVAYLCDSNSGSLLFFDDIQGSRGKLSFTGSVGSANLTFDRTAGTGIWEFADDVQFNTNILADAYGGATIGSATLPFASVYAQNIRLANASHDWRFNLGLASGSADANLVLSHDAASVLTAFSTGGIGVGAAADPGSAGAINALAYWGNGVIGIANCTVVTAGATITIKAGIVTAFTGC